MIAPGRYSALECEWYDLRIAEKELTADPFLHVMRASFLQLQMLLFYMATIYVTGG
jgi:hypothetical protein